MNDPIPPSHLVRKRQLAALFSVSPRTIDTWVSKRMIPYIEPNPRLHLFDPIAVKAALLAQFSIPANIPEELRRFAPSASGSHSGCV
jgi:phage terminase Nu1 subunit (DNA packaging protein)